MLALIRNRRCASETIESILRASFATRHCQLIVPASRRDDPVIAAEELHRTQMIYPRLDSISGHGLVPWSDVAVQQPELRFFTFLRSPLERCASEYQNLVSRGDLRRTFESWIESPSARNHQVRQLCGHEDAQTAIEMIQGRLGFVGLSERFDESLVLFRRWANDERLDIRYSSKRITRDSRIRVQLLRNLETRRLLLDANREDLKLHAFVEQTLFPQQINAYGPRFEMDAEAFSAFNVPPPVLPRQLPSILHRNFIHRPLVRWLTLPVNPSSAPLPPPKKQTVEPPLRRAA